MKRPPAFLAFDLGAESGRAVLGQILNDRFELEEIHRFPNGPVRLGESLHWDVLRLWQEMGHALSLAQNIKRNSLISLGVDSWGVDFGLLDKKDNLIGNPFHYRDRRTDGMVNAVAEVVSPVENFQQTGIQSMSINSLYQLFSMVNSKSSQLKSAATFLNIPDLFNFWFSGVKASEFSIATTTQCFNPISDSWAWDLLNRLEIPTNIFTNVVQPGTKLGKVRRNIKEEYNLGEVNIIAVTSHDTQSAVAALPIQTKNTIYLSSGTWSLMGIEVDRPVINEISRSNELTNEGCYGKKFCLQKNIVGLWILQECRREWAKNGQEFSYDDLAQMAAVAKPMVSFINPGNPNFVYPGEMTSRISEYCQNTKQIVPVTKAEFVRCIFESLALEYRYQVEQLSKVSGREIENIHVTGGGARNELLNQFTANATGRKVIAGPIEATALGNILVQAITAGYISSIEEGRNMIGRTIESREYEPKDMAIWNDAYFKYLNVRDNK